MEKSFSEVEAGLEKSGRVEDLIKLYDARSREVPPPEGAPLLNKAGELVRDRLKNHGRAEEFFRRSLLLNDKQREALLGLKLLFEQKQDQSALADTLEKLGSLSKGPESATFYLRAADIYEQKLHRRDRALLCCQQACRQHADDRASFVRVRTLFLADHKYISAFDALMRERKTFGDEGMAVELAAFAERLIDDPTEHPLVEKALKVALEIEPANPRVEKAQKALEKFEHTWRDRVRTLRGQSLEERDRKGAARLSLLVAKLFSNYDASATAKVKEALDRCFLLWPAMPDALTLIERLAEKTKDFKPAIAQFERMAIDTKDKSAQVDLWIRTGTLKLTRLEDKGGALDAFEKAVAIDASRADASGLAAELLLELEEPKGAIAILDKHLATVKDRQQQIALRLRLADLCVKQVDDAKAARGHLEAVLNLDGVNAAAAFELARLYVEESDAESLEPLVDLAVWAPRPVAERVSLCESASIIFDEGGHAPWAFAALARGLYLDPTRPQLLASVVAAGKKAQVIPELTAVLQRVAALAPPAAGAEMWRMIAGLVASPEAKKKAWEEVVKRAPNDKAAADALLAVDAPVAEGSGNGVKKKKKKKKGEADEKELERELLEGEPVAVAAPERTGASEAKAKLEAEARRLEGSAADPAAAAAIYRQILELSPDDVSALKRLGASCAAMGQWEEVARVAARLSDLAESLTERQEWRGRLAQLYAERLQKKEEAADLYLGLLTEGAASAAVVGGLERLASSGVRQAEISRALAPHYAKTGDYQRQVASLLVQLSTAQEMDQKKELLSLLATTNERHLADMRTAFEFRVRGLQVDPADADFRAEAIRLGRELSSHTELSRVLFDLANKSSDAQLSSSLLIEAGTLAEEGGAIDDAASALKLALEKAPDDPVVLAQLMQLYARAYRWEDCDQVLRRRIMVAETDAEKAPLYLKLAAISAELNRPKEAAQATQEAIKAGASEEENLPKLAEYLEKGGRISELAAALQKQIEYAEKAEDKDKVARLSLKRGQVLEAQLGDKSAALKNYSAILDQRPSDPDALAALEHLLTDAGCREDAAKALVPAYEALKEHRKLISALEVVAEASQDDLEKVLALKKAAYVHLNLLRQPELAFAALARALKFAPGDAQVRQAARQAAEDANQVDVFAEVLAELLPALKDTARLPIHRELAEVFEKKLAKREEAIAQLRAALELEGKNLDVLKGLQRLHRAGDDWPALADVLLTTAGIVPEPSEKVHLWREAAFLYEDKLSDKERAATAWRQIAERDPLDRESAAALDQLYTALDKPQELAFALELRRAQEGQSPQGREIAFRLAQVRQEKLQDSAGALQLYRQIVTEDPGHKHSREALEELVVQKGPVSGAALEVLDPVLVKLGEHQERVQLREVRMEGALPQEKSRLVAEMCAIYERDTAQPDMAFAVALKAFLAGVDLAGLAPELERLAGVTQSYAALGEAYERAAGTITEENVALGFYRRAAELREQLGQTDEAVRLWTVVQEVAPQDRQALDSLGRLYEKSQNAKSLSDVYAKKAQLSTDPAERLELLLKAGGAYEAAGDDAQSIEHYRMSLAVKKTLEGLVALDRLYLKAHRTEEEADVLDQLAMLTEDPDEKRQYLSRRALLLEKEGGPGEALAAFAHVLELLPGEAGAISGLERLLSNDAVKLEAARMLEPVYRSQNDKKKLVDILDLRLNNAQQDKRPDLLNEIAVLREALGQKAQAFNARMTAFSENPGAPELFVELDRLAAETGSFEDLAALYEEQLGKGVPDEMALDLWRRSAAIYGERLNRLDLAARAWTEVARRDQTDLKALEYLSAIYRKTRAFKELAQVMKRQVGLEKNVAAQVQLLFELAKLAEETLSDKPLATQCYQAILTRKPDDQNAIKFLSQVLQEQEKWPELAGLIGKEIQLCEAKNAQEEACELMVKLGRLKATRLGDPRGALDLYQGVLARRAAHPGAVGALEEMARSDSPLRGEAATTLEPIFAGGGDHLKSVQMLESRVSAAGTAQQRAELNRRIAQLYIGPIGNPSMAFLAATKALQEVPDDDASLKLAMEMSGPAEAQDELLELLSDVADKATEEKARLSIRRALATLKTQKGDPGATDAWKQVLELDSANPEALDRLSELLSKADNGPELAEVLRRKLQLTTDVEERANLQFQIGELQYTALNDPHSALATFRLVLETKPDAPAVLDRLEALCTELERWPELADVLSRRIALGMDKLQKQGQADPQSHKDIQDLKFRLGQVREQRLMDKLAALQVYTEILSAEPKHPGALGRLESILQKEPGNAAVLDVLIAAYRRGGEVPKLCTAVEARVGLEGDPFGRKPLLKELAQLRQVQEEPEMAFLALFRAFNDDPNDAELRADLERVADSAGTHDELVHAYEEVLPRIAEAKDAAAMCLKLGMLYEHRLKEPERAVMVYDRARTFDTEAGYKALPALDRLYSQMEAWKELSQVLETQISLAQQPPEKVGLLFRLGQLNQDRLQNPAAAALAYERILEVDKTHLASARLLEQLYEASNQVDRLYAVLKLQRDLVQGPEKDRVMGRMAQVSAEGLSDVDDSIQIYRELLAKNPKNEQAFAALEVLLEKGSRHQDLYELLKKKLTATLDPRELVRLNDRVGRVLFKMAGKPEEAIPYFKAALERDARHRSALESLRDIYDQLKRNEDLVMVLRRLLPLQEAAEGVKAVRLHMAEVLSGMNRREEALDATRRALEVEPHKPEELERVHGIFLGLRAFQDAARAMELSAAMHAKADERDEAVAAYFKVAELWKTAANKPENAGPALEKLLELDPANKPAYEQAKELYSKINDWRAYAQAVDRYLPHLVTDEDKIEALKELAKIQEQKLGQKNLAFMAECRALQLNPADDAVREEVERLADDTGSYDELAAVYDGLADEIPRGPLAERIYLKLAQIHDQKLDSPEDAEASLRKILEFDPTNQLALDTLAQMFSRRGADKEYVTALEQKLETAGSIEDRKVILREIARVYDERAQNPDEAANSLLRALDLDPDVETMGTLVALYRRQQRWSDVANTLLRARDLAATPEERGRIQVEIGEVYEREINDDEAAIAAYMSALEMDGGQRDALGSLERLYTKLDRPADLLEVYGRQLEIAPESETRERVKIYFKSASIWEDKYQNLENADTCIASIIEIDPTNVQAITMLVRLRRSQERWEDLVTALNLHLQVVTTPQDQAQLLVDSGEVYYHQLRQVDRAAEYYTKALEVDQSNRAAMHDLGVLYERSGNWPFALEMLSREAEVLGSTHEAVDLYHRMGKINEEMLMDIGSAKACFDRALQIDPGHLASIRALKGIYESAKDWTAYEQSLIQEAERTDDTEAKAKAYLEVGRHTSETKDDKEGAAKWYEEALRLSPDLMEAAKPLADIYIAREQWEQAERMLDTVVNQLPARVTGTQDEGGISKELCRQYYRLGYVVEKLGKKDKSLQSYEKAYQLDATYLPALEGLGNMLIQAQRLDEALKIYQSILIHHREDLTDMEVVEVYFQIGEIHQKLQQYDRAQNHFEKALAIDSHHEPALRSLISLADNAGKWDKAAEYRQSLVQVLEGEQKIAMLVELGMLAREKLNDAYMAIDAYATAHRLEPEELGVMDALYQLYRETRQGAKAAEVVTKLLLSEQMQTKPEKAKRIHFALGEIARDELRDIDRAVAAFNAALDSDYKFLEAFSAIESLLGSNQQWKKLEENYAKMIQRLPKSEETHGARMALWKALGDLYLNVLKQPQDGLMAYKVVSAGMPQEASVQETYGALAAQVPGNEAEAIGAYRRALLKSQNQGKVCSALAELAARTKDYDTAYLAAQVAQSLVGQVGDAEKEILAKLQPYAKRKEMAQRPLAERQLLTQLFHPQVRGPMGELMALLFNVAGHLWAVPLAQYQINPKKHRIDVATAQEYQIHHVRYVAKLLGMEHVEVYSPFLVATREKMAKRSNEPVPDPLVGVEICHTHPMTLRLGGKFFGEPGQKEVYYLLGRTMAMMRPELALASRLGPERLEAVFQASITLVAPNYRISAHPAAIETERKALEKVLNGPAKSDLSRLAQQYLKLARPDDFKNFLEGAELTGTRAGLFAAGEVEPVKRMVLNETAGTFRVSSKSKLRDVAVFALSDDLHALRASVGTNVEVQVQKR